MRDYQARQNLFQELENAVIAAVELHYKAGSVVQYNGPIETLIASAQYDVSFKNDEKNGPTTFVIYISGTMRPER